jgi:hypothetical protein
MKLIQGDRDRLAEDAEKALLNFAVTGSEQDKERVKALDAKLGRRATLAAVPVTCEPKP